MNIEWLSPLAFETPAGKMHTVTGMIEIAAGGGFDGGLVSKLVRDELDSVCGDKRASWGEVSYLYARHRMGATDVLLVSAGVVVNKGESK